MSDQQKIENHSGIWTIQSQCRQFHLGGDFDTDYYRAWPECLSQHA